MLESEKTSQLVDHLFRHEAGRMVSVLTCMLGFDRVDLAEDVVQETMIQALRSWPFQGVPDKPSAWLFRVAKNKALDIVRREKRFQQISPDIDYLHRQDASDAMNQPVFFDDEINDSQLRMLFAICHPVLGVEAQMAMCLKILCGLSVREIANAFLTTDETIAKRIYRAKEKIRQQDIQLEVPVGPQLVNRLDNVLKIIYLLFNEGYNSSQPDKLIRQDLCEEAIRLCLMLAQTPATQLPVVNALLALFCFQAARFDARTNEDGEIVLLADQNRSLWNQQLIQKGHNYLNQAAEGDYFSDYHLEAGIAMQHCIAKSYETTDWDSILLYYDLLLKRKPSAVVALHRTVVVAQVVGPEKALIEMAMLTGLEDMQYYHAILGDLYEQTNQPKSAQLQYRRAIELTPSMAEKKLLEQKISRLSTNTYQ